MQIDDVLEWARDGKWAIIESHPQVVAEAMQQLIDLRINVLDKAIHRFEQIRNVCPECGEEYSGTCGPCSVGHERG